MPRQPKVGDPVFFECLDHTITDIEDGKVRFESALLNTKAGRVGWDSFPLPETRPRFRTTAILSDLHWDDELNAWYLWGRLLCKGRGGVGVDQRVVIASLRDRGVIPGRPTRQIGSGPAGGEHQNLYKALFADSSIDWVQEIQSFGRGEGLSAKADAAVGEYKDRFKKKLVRGYAQPDINDSEGE
jgi:hypothetical protein